MSMEVSPVSEPGGYPQEIFGSQNVDEKFVCIFCKNILREPYQAVCGHRFCKSCIDEKHRLGQERIKCHCCQEEGAESYIDKTEVFPDNGVKRELNRQSVQCVHHGCGEKMSFKEFQEHFTHCNFRPVPCGQCEKPVSVARMVEHLSEECALPCQCCGTEIKVVAMQVHLETSCPKVPVTCPNCRQAGILREQLQYHLENECLGDQVKCPICKEQGIDQLVKRSDFHTHFSQGEHALVFVEKALQAINLQQQFSAELPTIMDKLNIVNGKVEQLAASNGGSSMAAVNVQQQVELAMGTMNERVDTKIGTFEGIANTLHRELDKVITSIEKLDRHRRELKDQTNVLLSKTQALERGMGVKDAAFAELETKVRELEVSSYDGNFVWRVSEFSKKHQDAVSGRSISIYSSPFFSSRHGYKMCARLYANGDGMGKGSHLSLFFVVMRGEYDALLQWPFKQRVTFTLINQLGMEHVTDSFRPDPNSSSFQKPSSNMNIASGCPLFLRLDILQNPSNGFLKDDTLFLKISIDSVNDPLSGSGPVKTS